MFGNFVFFCLERQEVSSVKQHQSREAKDDYQLFGGCQ